MWNVVLLRTMPCRFPHGLVLQGQAEANRPHWGQHQHFKSTKTNKADSPAWTRLQPGQRYKWSDSQRAGKKHTQQQMYAFICLVIHESRMLKAYEYILMNVSPLFNICWNKQKLLLWQWRSFGSIPFTRFLILFLLLFFFFLPKPFSQNEGWVLSRPFQHLDDPVWFKLQLTVDGCRVRWLHIWL